MPVQWYHGKVIKILKLSDQTRQFFVKVQEEDFFDFIPGQFVTMDLPVGEKRLHRWRSYSIANSPNKENILEFCIVKSLEGLGTAYLFDEINVGSILKFKGPDGGFVIPKNLKDNILMICTGTGIAPFISMLSHIRNQNLEFKNIHLIFGTRQEDSILYLDFLETMHEKYSHFTYDIVLSRENNPSFKHGYVHDVYMNMEVAKIKKSQIYICGWTQMIDDAIANFLLKVGCDKSNIHYELYG